MPANTSIIHPILDAARMMVRGRKKETDLTGYFGPGVVIAPIAPPGTEARGWNYWPFFNQNILPRPDAAITFQALRSLALYPLARICIENCKDVLASKSRQIRAVKQPGESNKDVDKRGLGDKNLKMLNDFFDCPDGEHDWDLWLRPWLEDVYVIDAASVLVRRSGANTIRELRVIDGAAIACKIDEWGYRPSPPDPAFQWLWSGTPSTNGGIPFVNLTTDQLVYRPRNIVPRNTVSSYLYGMSPTEQMADEISLGKNWLAFWLYCYTNGNMPDMIHVVPPNISTDQLQAAQKALDAEMSGQLYKQARAIHLLQGFVDRSQPGAASGDQLIATKDKLLGADPIIEMHMRKIAFGYGASAQRLMKQMSRMSAQTNQEASEEEGTEPVAASIKGMVDWIIAKIFNFGFNQYELTFDSEPEMDAVKRSTADKNDVDSGIISRDEARINRGLDPVGGDATELMITTATGTVPVDMAEQAKQAKMMADAVPKPEPNGNQGGGNNKVMKREGPRIDPAKTTVQTRQAATKLEHAILKVFMRQKEKAGIEAHKLIKLKKSDDEESKRIADAIYAAIESEFASLPVDARAALEQAALSGANEAWLQIEITDSDMIGGVNRGALEYASKRAAEMVGMKYNADGELVANPNAKWAISDTTRNRLREIIKKAYEEGMTREQIVAEIQDADVFSDARANMIARTETRRAQVGANFDAWKSSGVVSKVKWLAVGPDPCPICEDNDGVIRALGARFPSGDIMPLAHPDCYCIMVAVFEE